MYYHISYMLFYVPESTIPLKWLSIANFAIVARDIAFSDIAFCDVTTVDLWRHANAGYWHCDVIFVDCSCTRKLAQRRSSLMNNTSWLFVCITRLYLSLTVILTSRFRTILTSDNHRSNTGERNIMKFYLFTPKHIIIPRTKLQIYTLKLTTNFWHCKKISDYFWTRVYASVNRVSIGSANGLTPIRRQAMF